MAFVALALLVGLLVGSFLNVVIWRLPKMLERDWRLQAHDILGQPLDTPQPTYNLMLPHSHCPHCDHSIRAWENIPLISYVFLRGRCSNCAASIRLMANRPQLNTSTVAACHPKPKCQAMNADSRPQASSVNG